jgi:hypothetical protein
MMAGLSFDQLARNPDTIPGPTDTPLKNVPDPQIAPYLSNIDRLAFVGERGVPGDHEEPPHP